jgi:predicted RNase H-like nuclease
MTRWIGGLDGCRGAWAGVLLDLDDPARYRAVRVTRPADLLDGPEAPIRVGIDCPIGLEAHVTGGGRSADRAARAVLGAGRASVFPVPARAAVYAGTYEEAKALSRAHSTPPFAPSIQCWNILPAVRAVDGLLRARPDLMARLHEVHPEIVFRCLNGGQPLAAGKKGLGRQAGLAERRALLERAGLPEGLIAGRPPGIGADDHLDALAALVVARDLAEGRARPLPDPPDRDAEGLPVVIWMPADPSSHPLAAGEIPARSGS